VRGQQGIEQHGLGIYLAHLWNIEAALPTG
jgi:hypothetical protein